uniref:Uncharacterized protein n=1 Tax=Caenorhabditis japonica TaxID=281687 RepID=A0A8R1J051_CAEJA
MQLLKILTDYVPQEDTTPMVFEDGLRTGVNA